MRRGGKEVWKGGRTGNWEAEGKGRGRQGRTGGSFWEIKKLGLHPCCQALVTSSFSNCSVCDRSFSNPGRSSRAADDKKQRVPGVDRGSVVVVCDERRRSRERATASHRLQEAGRTGGGQQSLRQTHPTPGLSIVHSCQIWLHCFIYCAQSC